MRLNKTLSSIVASSFLAMSLSGCFGFMVKGGNYKPPSLRPPEVENYYSYTRGEIKYETTKTEDTEKYTVSCIKFKSSMHTTEKNDTVIVDYYDAKFDGKTPLIILSPILGGSNGESKIFAKYFANRGFSCAIVHRPEDRFPNAKDFSGDNQNELGESYAESLENILKQSIIDTRRAIDLFETFPDIDSEKIGSFGISMGGIKNSILAGVEPRLKVNIFVMAGADMEYILTHSKEEKVIEEVQNISKLIEKEKFFEDLKKNSVSDPKNFAQYIDDSNTLMYISLFDTVVPVKSQEKLRDLIGHPSTSYLLSGHYSAIIYILPPWNYIQSTSYNFFKDRFDKIKLRRTSENLRVCFENSASDSH